MLLIEFIAQCLNCGTEQIKEALHNREVLAKLNSHLRKLNPLQTIYKDKNGFVSPVYFGVIGGRTARKQKIFKGGWTVEHHYLLRHNIKLQYPYLPVVVEYGVNFQNKFYPMELLEINPPPGHSPIIEWSDNEMQQDKLLEISLKEEIEKLRAVIEEMMFECRESKKILEEGEHSNEKSYLIAE